MMNVVRHQRVSVAEGGGVSGPAAGQGGRGAQGGGVPGVLRPGELSLVSSWHADLSLVSSH